MDWREAAELSRVRKGALVFRFSQEKWDTMEYRDRRISAVLTLSKPSAVEEV